MLSLMATILGFGTSFLPDVLNFFNKKQDLKHELDLMDKKAEILSMQSDISINELNIKADISEMVALHSEPISGTWADGIRVIVRPLITLTFFAFFIYLKIEQLIYLTETNSLHNYEALLLIWDEETAVLFSTVMGFWFGTRQRDKATGTRKKPTAPKRKRRGVSNGK